MGLPPAFSHLFLPSAANNHHPHILRREAIVTALSFLVLIEAVTLGATALPFGKGIYGASVLPAALTSLTNEARSSEHLAALTWNAQLATAATAKAQDMAEKGYFAHQSPDGTLPWKWIRDSGYVFQYAGENLAVDFTDSNDVVVAWLNSPTHKANLLGENYTQIGIGVATGIYKGKEATFVVQYFGKPVPGAASVATAAPRAPPIPQALNSRVAPAATSSLVLGVSVSDVPASVVASPKTTSNTVFITIATFFALLLIAALVFRKRLPRGAASMGGLTVIAAALALVILNGTLLPSAVELPLDTQSATVIEAG